MAKEGLTRQQLGREAFLERVWAFIHHYGDRILYQLRSLGFSLDWSRYVFTMDPGPARAVRTAFKRLYDRGLIYRANRMVNWDPVNQTTVSDLEVDQIEEDGHLWYIRYDVDGEPGQSVTVATTRPETMLGDTAVAVNPDDERYQRADRQDARAAAARAAHPGRRGRACGCRLRHRRGEGDARARLERLRGRLAPRSAADHRPDLRWADECGGGAVCGPDDRRRRARGCSTICKQPGNWSRPRRTGTPSRTPSGGARSWSRCSRCSGG